MNTIRTALIAATTALVMAGPAAAGVFTYNAFINNGIGAAKLVIDGHAGTARYTGANINVTLTGDSFKNFKGTAGGAPSTLKADNITGTFTRHGTTYDAFASTQPKHTLIQLTGDSNFLWTYGKDAGGNTFDFDGKGALNLVSNCQTNCGGGAGGGGGNAGGGGGQVPAPGPLGLIAAMGLFAAWRRKVATKA